MIQDTSIRAYEDDILPKLNERQKEVRGLLLTVADMTNAEIARALDRPINVITPRTNELVKLGAVLDAGKRTCRVTGRTAHAWKLKWKPIPQPPATPQPLFNLEPKVVQTNQPNRSNA